MTTFLQENWQEITRAYTKDEALISLMWEELYKSYTAPSRHYHTLEHLHTMLRLTNEHLAHLSCPYLVKFAIFYHDVVYQASLSDNEEKSAQQAQERLKVLGLPSKEIKIIEEMILATKLHQPSSSPDTNLLLDFDLSVLGAPWADYLLYSQQIRKEYSIYPDFLYRRGRKKVLRHFLETESIYHTSFFKNRLEQKARENMERELTLLEKQ